MAFLFLIPNRINVIRLWTSEWKALSSAWIVTARIWSISGNVHLVNFSLEIYQKKQAEVLMTQL
jgi:hypothetical protein